MRSTVDIGFRDAQGPQAFIEELCGVWSARYKVLKSPDADSQIRGNQSNLLVTKRPEFLLSPPPIPQSAK
jgi:hypothetical protein